MPGKPANHGKVWTAADNTQLRREAAGNTPTRVIALHMSRSETAIRSRAVELGVSLKPTNQSSYGAKKKS